MKKFIVTVDKSKSIVDEGDKSIVYIFENITGYEDEVFDLLDQKKMSLSQLESIVNSWGGKFRAIPLKQLIMSYYKNNLT